MFDRNIKRIKANPIGTIIGLVGGYYVTKRYLASPSTILSLIVTALGGLGGAYVESKFKAYKSMPNKSDVELTAMTREQFIESRKK
jgi:LytS/YehU family sensor histidine kinase